MVLNRVLPLDKKNIENKQDQKFFLTLKMQNIKNNIRSC